MPTFGWVPRFRSEFRALTPAQQAAFLLAVTQFVEDLRTGGFRKGLRVKGVKGAKGIFEMTWANDGRATFQYGEGVIEGEPHVIWRRVGTHDGYDEAASGRSAQRSQGDHCGQAETHDREYAEADAYRPRQAGVGRRETQADRRQVAENEG